MTNDSTLAVFRPTTRKLLAAMLAGSALTLPGAALGQTVTWDGSDSDNWDQAPNWSGNAVPGAGATATINSAAAPNQPVLTTPQSVAQTNVTAGTLTVASQLTSPVVNISNVGSLVVSTAGSLIGNLQTVQDGTVDNAGVISGSVTHDGDTFVNSGTITGLVLNSAIFTSTGTLDFGLENLGGGTVTLSGTVAGEIANSGRLIVSGNLAGTNGLINSGAGIVTVDAGAIWSGLTGIDTDSTAVDGVLINGTMILAPTAGFTVRADAEARVAVGGTLTLDNPASGMGTDRVLVEAGGTLRNQGTVAGAASNSGTLINDGDWTGTYASSAGGVAINNGIWHAVVEDEFFFTVRGTFTNNGLIDGNAVSADGAGAVFVNLGTVDSRQADFSSLAMAGGILDNRADWIGDIRVAAVTSPSSGTLLNSGTVTGKVFNRNLGNFTSTGTITAGLDNAGTATVRGTLNGPVNSTAGRLTINGDTASNGALTITDTGTVIVNAGAVWRGLTAVTNAATLQSQGTIVGRIINEATGAFSSNGTVTAGLQNAGLARVSGTLSGTIDNTGTLDIATTVTDAALTNSGTGTVRVSPFSSWTGATSIENSSSAGAGFDVEGEMTVGGIFRTSSIVAGGPAAVVDLRGGTVTIAPTGQLIIGDTLSPLGVITPGSGIVRVRRGSYESSGTLDVQGALSIGAAFQATGLLEVLDGGVARAASLCLGCGNTNGAGTGEIIVDGTQSRFDLTSGTGQRAIGNASVGGGTGRVTVSNGGSFVQTVPSTFGMNIAAGSSLLVTDPGSVFDLPAPLVTSGDLTFTNFSRATIGSLEQQAGAFQVLDGAVVQQGEGNLANWSFGQQSTVLIAGGGTDVTVNGALSIGSSNIGEGSGDFIVEQGAALNVLSASPSGLAFGENRNLIVRSGARANLTGGLSVDRGTVMVQDATLAMGGALNMAGSFAGNTLNLFNADFSAPSISLNANAVQGNSVINLGGTATGAAGAVGTFAVGQVTLAGSGEVASQFIINHTASNFVIGASFVGFGGNIRHLAGDTVFTGNQANGSFGGQTVVTGGTLSINGTHGNNGHEMTVSGGSVLGGSGRIGGTVTLADATLAPGNSPGTLTFANDLALGAGSILAFELGAPSGVAGVDSDLVVVGGDLTLDGTLNITDIGGFGPGLYRLFDYGGTLTDNGLELGAIPGSVDASELQVQTSIASQINLLFGAPTTPGSFTFWDGSDTAGNGRIDAGNGVWSASATNWTTLDGGDNGAYRPEDFLIFTAPTQVEVARAATPSATAGTVVVDDAAGAVRLANGAQFAVDGYTVTGDAIVLDATIPCGECTPLPGQVILRVGDGTGAGSAFVATIASPLIGAAGLEKTDLGTLILQGANSYAGGTRVTGGTVQGNTASLQGAIAIGAAGTLLFDQAGAGTYAGTVSGSGAMVKEAGGALTLTGASDGYAGTTAVTGGALLVNGTLGTAQHRLTASGGAVLGGTGTIGGDAVLADATLAAGTSPGTLTFANNLALGAGSILAFELGAPGGVAGVASDLVNVGGNLTLDGTLNVTDIGGFGVGLYRLFNYGGTLTDNGLSIGTVPQGVPVTDLQIQTEVANQVNLLFAAPPARSFVFWDGSDAQGNGRIDARNGSWTAAATNWTTSDGSVNGAYQPGDFLLFTAPTDDRSTNVQRTMSLVPSAAAVPSSAGGLVTVDDVAGAVTIANGMQFAVDGYTITGDALGLAAPGVIVRVGDGTDDGAAFTATLAVPLTGTGGLNKTDLGTLILSGANTYTGGTTVTDGTLQGDASSLQGAIAIGQAGTLLFDQGRAGTYAGILSGAGQMRKEGTGVLTLSGGSGGFAGTATLAAGGIALSGTMGSAGGGTLITAAGTTLTGNGTVGSLDLSGSLAPGAGAATFNVAGDLTVRAGSTYLVDVAANGSGDRIRVGGRAILEGGTVAITALDPDLSYTDGSVYRIVDAAGGLTGTFAGLTESSAFLDFTLGYDLTGAFLTTSVIAQFPDVALTYNQRQASTGLADLGQIAGSDSLAVYNTVLLLAAAPARDAFDASSGEIYPTLLAGRQRQGLALGQRMAMRGQASGGTGLALWGGVLGDRSHVDGDGNGARAETDGVGAELGLDYRADDHRWSVGIGGGWQDGQVSLAARRSNADTQAWHVGAYARHGTLATGFTATASVVHADAAAKVTRQIGFGAIARTASGKADVTTTAALGEIRFGLGSDRFAFGPLVSFDVASSKLARLAETGTGALDLSVEGKRESWTRLGLGGFARYSAAAGFVDIGVRYLRGDAGRVDVDMALAGSPTAFNIRTASGGRSAVRIDASTQFALGDRWALSGNLGAARSSAEAGVDGNVRLSFRF